MNILYVIVILYKVLPHYTEICRQTVFHTQENFLLTLFDKSASYLFHSTSMYMHNAFNFIQPVNSRYTQMIILFKLKKKHTQASNTDEAPTGNYFNKTTFSSQKDLFKFFLVSLLHIIISLEMYWGIVRWLKFKMQAKT